MLKKLEKSWLTIKDCDTFQYISTSRQYISYFETQILNVHCNKIVKGNKTNGRHESLKETKDI